MTAVFRGQPSARVMLAALCAAVLATSWSPAADAPTDDGAVAGFTADVLAARLQALSPEEPEAYFLLAEEIAYEVRTPDEAELARQLFALTLELSIGPVPDESLAASACVGLASLASTDRDRVWLMSIARALDARQGSAAGAGADARGAFDQDVAFEAASVLGFVRAGDGIRARELLARPVVRAALDRYGAMLTGTTSIRASDVLERIAERWPCRECRGERMVITRHTGDVRASLCYSCAGRAAPEISRAELVAHLRLESVLLRAGHVSWGAQVAADGGAVLRDTDPAQVGAVFGVEASRPFWRSGRWVEPPEPRAPR